MTIDGKDLLDLPEPITGRRISTHPPTPTSSTGRAAGQSPLRLEARPLREPQYDDARRLWRRWYAEEAVKAGNPTMDINSDWVDYQAAGATGPDDILTAIRPVLDAVLGSQDILDLALRSTVNTRYVALAEHIVDLRSALRQRTQETELGNIVVPLDFDAYNPQATVGENPRLRFDEAADDEQSPVGGASLF